MFEDMYGTIPQESREGMGYYTQLEKTISDENVEDAVLFVDGSGELEAVMRIYSLAGVAGCCQTVFAGNQHVAGVL